MALPDTISASQAKSLGWGASAGGSNPSPSLQQNSSKSGLPDTISASEAKSMGWSSPPPQQTKPSTPGFRPLTTGAVDFSKGVGKTALGFLNQGDVLGTMNRIAKGDTAGMKDGAMGLLDSANPLKTMHSLAGENPDWTGKEGAPQPSQNPDWSGTSPAQRQQDLQPSNYMQKVGQTSAIVGANLLPIASASGLKMQDLEMKNGIGGGGPFGGGAPSAEAIKANTDKHITSTATDWQKPTTMPDAKYNKAKAVLAQSPDTPKFLASQKLDPNAHIEQGKYNTGDSASALEETAGQMSHDTLRPSLQKADAFTPKTPISELIPPAIERARSEPNQTPRMVEDVITNIRRDAAALQRKYPQGMGLTDMHDEKISATSNGGFRPDKSALDNNSATANRSMGDSLAKMVEKKAPPEIPVHDFNKYLSQYYKGADYLRALDTKTIPYNWISNVAHRGAQILGTIAGHGVGGGILGGVGGYMIGGALEHAVENMSRPMRATFMQNLEKTQPEAFTKVQEFLNSNKSRKPLLQLPPGATPMGAGKDTSGMMQPSTVGPKPQFNPRLALPEGKPGLINGPTIRLRQGYTQESQAPDRSIAQPIKQETNTPMMKIMPKTTTKEGLLSRPKKNP